MFFLTIQTNELKKNEGIILGLDT